MVGLMFPTGDANLIRERFRPLPPLLYKEMKALFSGMLQEGIIMESSSPWAAPIVMVKMKDGSWQFCVVYRNLNCWLQDAFPLPRIEYDNIIVYSPDFATHLKLRPNTCKVFHCQVKFLGQVVDQNGVKPDPDKMFAVTDWPVPTTEKQLKAFLALAGYDRRFVSGFVNIAHPLNALMVGIPNDKKLSSRPLTWSAECQVAFEALKGALTHTRILAYAAFTQPFILYMDASQQGLGAVLAQVQKGKEQVISYASWSLHPTECNDANYSSFKLELLALKWAITEKLRLFDNS